MKCIALTFVYVLLMNYNDAFTQVRFVSNIKTDNGRSGTVIIEMRLQQPAGKEKAILQVSPVDFVGKMKWETIEQKISNGTVKWLINSNEPYYVSTSSLFKNWKYFMVLAEPGDNVIITADEQDVHIVGSGAGKYELQYKMYDLIAGIAKPKNRKDYLTTSLEDFFEWNRYLNKQLELVLPLIDSYKTRISPFAYNFIRTAFIDQNIDDRSDKFYSLEGYARKNGMTGKNLSDIYDSIYYPTTQKWFEYTSTRMYGNWKPILYKLKRKYLFNTESENFDSTLMFKTEFYRSAINTYKGLFREKFISDYFPRNFMQKLGFISVTEQLLAEYYAEPGYPEYKRYMKEYEIQQRELINEKKAPDFTLTDLQGRSFTKDNVKGKIAVFDFWFTGCTGCIQMSAALDKIKQQFAFDTNLVFVNVCVDTDKAQWLKSIARQKYTSAGGIQLYTGGKGTDHEIIRKYAIEGYPALWIMDPYGRIVKINAKQDPRNDNGHHFMELLRKQLAYLKDGPYVQYEDRTITAYSIDADSLKKLTLANDKAISFSVQTDQNKPFTCMLQRDLKIEAAESNTTGKMLVLSDIEGNFEAFRKLLQANGVIDGSYNWTFENNHLVFGGDMFDRGQQVTECLWLIYSLEEKARAAGGDVHFILGNHEIMNLLGDHRYVQQKYKDNAQKIGKPLVELYGENNELGRWLRTKNMVEKINDLLFVHGGISREVAKLSLTIQQMNDLLRSKLGSNEGAIAPVYSVLFDTKLAPYWFRDYYEQGEEKDPRIIKMTELDEILQKFNVRHIVTGHTIVSDTISIWYEGKVINIDTKHAEDKSEALFVDGNKFYRVNAEGKKILLSEVQRVDRFTKN